MDIKIKNYFIRCILTLFVLTAFSNSVLSQNPTEKKTPKPNSSNQNQSKQSLSQDEFFKKMNKSFDILGALYKELAINYLIDVDPELLMQSAIDGMLKDLDPYTDYYSSEDETSSDMLEGSNYVGFGIRISRIDSAIYVYSVRKGFGADSAGFKPGDEIISIDGTKFLD